MDFAKDILKDHEKDWGKFPIYLKATAGMRQLSYNDREAILREVREYLGNPETCPFYFAFDQARVISGEEVGLLLWLEVRLLVLFVCFVCLFVCLLGRLNFHLLDSSRGHGCCPFSHVWPVV